MPVYIFTHIPKTAGTSVKTSVLFPSIRAQSGDIVIYYGVRRLWNERKRDIALLTGHIPYGFHLMMQKPARYITFLREPVDQAISYYYYVLQCGERNPGHPGGTPGHPDLDDAQRLGLEGFYSHPRYQNMQTRYTAGWWWDSLVKSFPYGVPKNRMLSTAKRNLSERYWFVGLLEDISVSQQLLAAKLGGVDLGKRDESRRTRIRPKLSDVDDEVKTRLREYNSLDVELYGFARRVYERQLRESTSDI